ncbi:MAG: putative lipid II flippase FtsW [Oleiphilaceae bacterium]|nr:putative lipid II flippase FtsW [Oleiphilaceae bacterium]
MSVSLNTSISRASAIDRTLVVAAASLLLLGLVMIASASIDVADARNGNPFHYAVRHGLFIVMGLMAAVAVYQVPTSAWQNKSWLCLSIALFLLVLVLLPGVGKTVNGSTRWIGLGVINLQPSELAKLLLVAYLSAYLVRRNAEVRSSWWGFLKPMFILSFAAALLLAEPDFGATVVIACAFLGMIFLSGARLGQFILLIFASIAVGTLLILSQPYRLQRLIGYTDPWADQFGSGYQLTQSLIAFGRGDWWGVGLGNSVQKQFYLPEAHTDFVFAIIGEEFGLLGSCLVVALFSVLVYRAVRIGMNAERLQRFYDAYFAYGIAILFAVQAFINMGVNMGMLPTKGLTLPLVSYGGSSLIVSCMALAVLLRIHRQTASSSEEVSQNQMGGAAYAR